MIKSFSQKDKELLHGSHLRHHVCLTKITQKGPRRSQHSFITKMTRSKISSFRKQKSCSKVENGVEHKLQERLMDYRRLMSKLLPLQRLAMKAFCVHQKQEAHQGIRGAYTLSEVLKEHQRKDSDRAEKLNGVFVLMFPPEEPGEFPAPESFLMGNTEELTQAESTAGEILE